MSLATNPSTLTKFISENLHLNGGDKDFLLIFLALQTAGKIVSNAVKRAGWEKLFGLAGTTNVQGEEVKKLDIFSNQVFRSTLEQTCSITAMVSEEDDGLILCNEKFTSGKAKYTIAFDPLDGSSNIDANVSIGSIFSIHNKISAGPIANEKDVLQIGQKMVAGGYIMYGSTTIFVVSLGKGTGVHGFTLDEQLGEYILTHPEIKISPRGKIYSVNEANSSKWDQSTLSYVEGMKKNAYSLRYIGSMVADVHRTLLYGGVFMYPADKKSPNGKLRLLYELQPMAFLMENAGGKATTGKVRLLELVPEQIHQRAPIYMGSKDDITDIEKLF